MTNRPVLDPSWTACPDCDLLVRLPEIPSGAAAHCPRCEVELWRRRDDSLDRTLAFALTAAVLYAIANAVPMLSLSAVGREASTTVVEGAQHLWRDGREIVAALVLFTAVVAPGLQIGCMLAIALGARSPQPPVWVGTLLRLRPGATTWSMIEVMLLGVLVALVKIADYATVIPGVALYALGALVFVLASMQASFDPRVVWERVIWSDTRSRREASGLPPAKAPS